MEAGSTNRKREEPQRVGCGQIEEYPPVVFIPGIILPAQQSFGPLLKVIGREVLAVVKDLEVYEQPVPPPDYSLETEIRGIRRAADSAEFDSFHLVGYSGGGAIALAFAARYPARLRSLALIEPAWIGRHEPSQPESERDELMKQAMELPPEKRMAAFRQAEMKPGVEPPPLPEGPPPAWMARRPEGVRALAGAFEDYDLDRGRLRRFAQPAYEAVGGLSHPAHIAMARILAGIFQDFRYEVYEETSHMDPPHRAQPERFAAALRILWEESEQAASPEAA